MAATVSAWGKPGGWARDAEEQEAEEIQQQLAKPIIPSSDYPDLAAAAAAPKTKKKGKGQKLSLQEFASFDAAPKFSAASAYQPSRGLTHEILALPTGPRERTEEELAAAGGRGFRSYGTRDEQPRRQRESSFAPPSSRADEIDDWGAAKKFTPASNGSDRRGREGGFFSDSQSRADEVDSWASRKAFVPSDGGRRMPERRSAFESNSAGGGGRADSDNWVKRKEEEGRKFGSSGGSFDSLRERRGGGSGSSGDSPTGGSGPVERPRLNLQPRTLPVTLPPPVVNNVEPQNGEALAKPEIVARPKGANPFGNARPREEVLKEKGRDWKELEEKLEAAKIKDEEQCPPVGKRGFGTGGWRGGAQEDRVERTWRKPAETEAETETETETSRPASAEIKEAGPAEEAEDNKEAQI